MILRFIIFRFFCVGHTMQFNTKNVLISTMKRNWSDARLERLLFQLVSQIESINNSISLIQFAHYKEIRTVLTRLKGEKFPYKKKRRKIDKHISTQSRSKVLTRGKRNWQKNQVFNKCEINCSFCFIPETFSHKKTKKNSENFILSLSIERDFV